MAAELREAGRRAATGPAVAQAAAGLGVRAGSGRVRRSPAGGCCGASGRCCGRRPECRPADRVGRFTPDTDGPAQVQHPGHRDLPGRVQGGGARRAGALEGSSPEGSRRPRARRRPRRWHAGALIALVPGQGQPHPCPQGRTTSAGGARPRLRPLGGLRMARPGGPAGACPAKEETGELTRPARLPRYADCWRRRTPTPPNQRRTKGSQATPTIACSPTAIIRSSPGTPRANAGTAHSIAPKPVNEPSMIASIPGWSIVGSRKRSPGAAPRPVPPPPPPTVPAPAPGSSVAALSGVGVGVGPPPDTGGTVVAAPADDDGVGVAVAPA